MRKVWTEKKVRNIISVAKYLIGMLLEILSYIIATAGAEGRAALMREIELGKLLGGNPNQPNIVKFIGCVTRGGKRLIYIYTLIIYRFRQA